MQSKVEIRPIAPIGTFVIDDCSQVWICKDADDVGANLEQVLWPLVEKPLKENKPLTITIEFEKL